MEVRLLSYQQDALEILLYTKNTRLKGAVTLEDIKAWPMEEKLSHLAYMKDTIKSSWEFANYIFEISGVTRAFTHQLVRTRTASFAQESQRTVDARDAGWLSPNEHTDEFDDAVRNSLGAYTTMVDSGLPVQHARGILPTNIHTSIIMGANLRTLAQMAETRLCYRTQGEYQDVFKLVKARVVEVHPWADDFINVWCVQHGTCCFPRYEECPIQGLTFRIADEAKSNLKKYWVETQHEAVPVSKNGRTM